MRSILIQSIGVENKCITKNQTIPPCFLIPGKAVHCTGHFVVILVRYLLAMAFLELTRAIPKGNREEVKLTNIRVHYRRSSIISYVHLARRAYLTLVEFAG